MLVSSYNSIFVVRIRSSGQIFGGAVESISNLRKTLVVKWFVDLLHTQWYVKIPYDDTSRVYRAR